MKARFRFSTACISLSLSIPLSAVVFPSASQALDEGPGSISREKPALPDSAARARYGEYLDAYVRAQPFVRAAEKARIRVEPESVSARIGVYAQMFPGKLVDSSRVARQLKVEKYLEAQGLRVDEREVEERLAALGIPAEKVDFFRSALKAERLFARRDVEEMGEKALDLAALENWEKMEGSLAYWPLEEIRLPGPASRCLARLDGECWASVAEFNAAVAEHRTRQGVPLDSARASILRRFLADKYFSSLEELGNPGLDQDSLLEAMMARRETSKWTDLAKSMGRTVNDPQILRETYDKYYRELFRSRQEAMVDIIASSDSAYLDSIRNVLELWARADSIARAQGTPRPQEPSLPWLTLKEERLPAALSARTSKLGPGATPLLVRLPAGFFLARVRSLQTLPEVSFRKAFPRLLFLATRDKYARMDSVLAARSRKYYDSHPEEFRIPDTLTLTAWLAPFRFEGQVPRLSPAPGPDTASFAPIRISSLDLPAELQLRLRTLSRTARSTPADKPPKLFSGPMKGEFGQWYFRIEKSRKASGKRSYASVKQEIVRNLTRPDLPAEFPGDDSRRSEVLLIMGKAASYKSRATGGWESLDEEQIGRMIRSGAFDTSMLPDGLDSDKRLAMAKKRYMKRLEEGHINEKQGFLKRLEIDFAALNRK